MMSLEQYALTLQQHYNLSTQKLNVLKLYNERKRFVDSLKKRIEFIQDALREGHPLKEVLQVEVSIKISEKIFSAVPDHERELPGPSGISHLLKDVESLNRATEKNTILLSRIAYFHLKENRDLLTSHIAQQNLDSKTLNSYDEALSQLHAALNPNPETGDE